MKTSETHISYRTRGRYFSLGELEDGKHLLIALHGYGYLAEYFIRKFHGVDTEKYVVICPEGPHRFYQSGTNGRVGASWMTKEDRLTDIQNYVNFLDTLLENLKDKTQFKSITLLGFSQGGATASRWLAYGKHTFDRFILWATVFPPDMDRQYCEKFNNSTNYFVFGTKDEYYTPDKVHEHFHELNQMNIPFEMLNFNGNHDIHEETLLSILHE
ncbi:MAG: alpha/beta fold hydrolase [Crocinitomicaceae bacterium]|nr:alpha/beta fold hydrolase [Crocinitomicaceae bacterium]